MKWVMKLGNRGCALLLLDGRVAMGNSEVEPQGNIRLKVMRPTTVVNFVSIRNHVHVSRLYIYNRKIRASETMGKTGHT